MPIEIVLPLTVLLIVVVAGAVWYRRAMGRLASATDERTVSGARLTSEHLRRLPSPPWRVVFEIGDDKLGDVDHVVVGPPGVIALVTVVTDRPDHEISVDPTLVAAAAVTRGDVDDLARGAGSRCDLLAKVFWGSPRPDEPPATEIAPGSVAVEGQRLDEWLGSLAADGRTQSQVDQAWQAITTGIGRPDPLA